MIYDETNAPLEDADGDTVVLAANTGRNRDKNWARNYITAKTLAASGRIQRIVARVVVTKEPLHTLHAFRQCVGAGHPSLTVCLTGERQADVDWVKARLSVPLVECQGVCDACPGNKVEKPPVIEPVIEPESEPEPTPEPDAEDTGVLDMHSVLNQESETE